MMEVDSLVTYAGQVYEYQCHLHEKIRALAEIGRQVQKNAQGVEEAKALELISSTFKKEFAIADGKQYLDTFRSCMQKYKDARNLLISCKQKLDKKVQ